MGSVRKKKEKQKDFQKAKLKVGKTKAKPTNYTDTSFVAKAISLPNQSITRNVDFETDLIKRLSLVKHHSHQTRKETLIYIEQHLPETPSLYKQILTAVVPLIIDQSSSVRTSLISLLVAASKKQPNLMELHARSIVLFIQSAMTHIVPEIRNDSTKFLDILIEYGKDSLVRSAWIKTLKSFFSLLSWTLNESKQSVSLAVTTSSVTNNSSKSKKQSLESLLRFIKAGILDDQDLKDTLITTHPLTSHYLLPNIPQPFAQLKLFTVGVSQLKNKNTVDKTIDLNTISCEDSQTRKKIFLEFFVPQIMKNVVNIIKDGGEVGKSARSLEKFIEKLLEDEKTDDD
ncbi:hypothetical protein WICMUC_003727 [Wickerhamomyces mucosus]|uniref:Pre-rRNA-processing protein n=1 Tax=Wickerhamomyces mucosus TaxID=1378264 RepID=A0A9P8PJG2_9ASCO|nr:hypothetical protein WICMUC_003727 [Wickerhamomyces mucosus]